jgi:YD repeat-containing protein
MPLRRRHGLLIIVTVIELFFTSVITSYAETNYIYDELNRLKRVEYGDGSVVEYTYDKTGNRFQVNILPASDTTPPTTTASPAGGVYNSAQPITLTCSDGTGSGCDKVYYTTDGSTPTTSSPVYSSPINILGTTTLKFFAKDLAGNSESVKIQTYTIDTTPPTGTVTINAGVTYTNTTNVTLALTCNDTNSCSQMKFSNNNVTYSTPEAYAPTKAWTLTSGDGKKGVHAKFKDTPGNWSVVYYDTIILDTTAPTGTVTINSGATYTSTRSITLTLTCSDTNGCSQMQFSNDNVTYSTPEVYATSKAWTLTSGDGAKTVYVKFKDRPGIWSSAYNDTIFLDTTYPTTAASPAGGIYSTAQSVTLSCSDSTGSGCDKVYYTTDGSTPTTSSPVYSSPINILGTTTLKFFAKDLAGNSESVKTQAYTIDTTPPTGTVTINAGATYTNTTGVTLALTCNDANGCSQMKFSNNNVTYSTPEAYAPTKAWTLTSGDGKKGAHAKFKDTPGNWSVVYYDTIILDTTAPVTTASPAGGTYNISQSVTLTCTDGIGSGCGKIYYTKDGSTPTTSSPVYSSPINISVTTTLKFFARDLAGNNEVVKIQVYTISGP